MLKDYWPTLKLYLWAAIAVIMAYIVYDQVGDKKYDVPLKLGDAAFSVNNVLFWQTDSDGRLQASVKLDDVGVYEKPHRMLMQKLQLQWSGEKSLSAEFSANKALANATGDKDRADKLTLSEQVFAKVRDNNNTLNNIELHTELMNIDVANKLLSVPVPVRVQQGDSTLQANRLDANMHDGTFTLYGVKVVYQP